MGELDEFDDAGDVGYFPDWESALARRIPKVWIESVVRLSRGLNKVALAHSAGPFFHGASKNSENHMALEGRALLYAVRNAAVKSPGSRIVFLVDNLGLALAGARSRATLFTIFVVLRMIYSLFCLLHCHAFFFCESLQS